MNRRDINEIKRRIKPEKNNFRKIVGCYVNGEKKIIANFGRSLANLSIDEETKYANLFRKVLSGRIGRNLINVSFTSGQVTSDESYKLIKDIRDSELDNEELLTAFFSKVIENSPISGNFLVLLSMDYYDVIEYGSEEKDGDSENVFKYILCALCPVKQGKIDLAYSNESMDFRTNGAEMVVAMPKLGFMFPAFEERSANISGLLYYTSSKSENYSSLASALFPSTLPPAAEEQKDNFNSVLTSSLKDECSFEVVKNLHDKIETVIEEYNADRSNVEELHLSKKDIRSILVESGVSNDGADRFETVYTESLGDDKPVSPENIISTKKYIIRTPDVEIKANPLKSDIISAKVIDGVEYLLVRADGGVTLNGVPVKISDINK